MDQINGGSVLGEYVQYGKWTFKNATDQLRKVTDPEEVRKFQENCVVFNPTVEEQKDSFRAEFSDFAMDRSPVISDVKREVYGQAEAAIGRFFDGAISAEELADTYQSLSDRLLDACKDRGYPCPLWGGMMGPAFQETFYGEFRRMVLDGAVSRNNAEGRGYITGDMTAQRNWKYYNSDYYYKSEEAVSALTEKFTAMAEERGWQDTVSVEDYKAKGLNLYYNFNSALYKMTTSDPRVSTDSGVSVGDSLARVREQYPDIVPLDWYAESGLAYVWEPGGDAYCKHIAFFTQDDIVTGIEIENLMDGRLLE